MNTLAPILAGLLALVIGFIYFSLVYFSLAQRRRHEWNLVCGSDFTIFSGLLGTNPFLRCAKCHKEFRGPGVREAFITCKVPGEGRCVA